MAAVQLLAAARTLELTTGDGAIAATLHGEAWSTIGGSETEGAVFRPYVVINARAPLSEVVGRLRVYPEPGARAYQTVLLFSAWLSESELFNGGVSPAVFLDLGNDTGEDYWPLNGAFGRQE